MSSRRGTTLFSSGLVVSGAVLLALAPTAQAKPDPGTAPPTGSGGGVVVREVEVPTPVDDGAFEPLQAGIGALVGALAGAGALAGSQRFRRPRLRDYAELAAG